jgi:hypothetical protein
MRENARTAHVLLTAATPPGSDGHDRTRRPSAQRGQRQRHQLSVARSCPADGRHGQRELAAITAARSHGLDLLPQARDADAGHRCPVGPGRPGLQHRHGETVGSGGTRRRYRRRGVRTADQRAAPRAARRRLDAAARLDPARPAAARARCHLRRRRPQPEDPGSGGTRNPLRGRPRAARDQRSGRRVGLHPAQPRRQGGVGAVLPQASRGAAPEPGWPGPPALTGGPGGCRRRFRTCAGSPGRRRCAGWRRRR